MNRLLRGCWRAALFAALFIVLAWDTGTSLAHAQYKWEAVKPMVFFLAKGAVDSCGSGCAEWIAAEGPIGPNSAERLRSLLVRLGKDKPPIVFNSTGGLRSESLAIGRLLRQHGMTAGVGRTFVVGCEEFIGNSNPNCDGLKKSTQKTPARIVTALAECSSACFHALLGAKDRWVPPGSHLAIHSSATVFTKGNQVSNTGGTVDTKARAQQENKLRQYFREMGFSENIVDIANKIPHESGHYLTRDEIVGFGIDRRQQIETPWMLVSFSAERKRVAKYVNEPIGSPKKAFPTSLFEFTCSDTKLLSLNYFRGMAPNRPETPQLEFFAGDQRAKAHFREAAPQKAIENQRIFERYTVFPDKDFMQHARKTGIGVIETSTSAVNAQAIKLSPVGFDEVFSQLPCG